LLEFISFRRKAHAVSVYLAPREILLALFQDERCVDDIINEREAMHAALNNEKATPMALADQLKEHFQNRLASGIDPNTIDFRVSKTKP
jgi:hypothetical protein